MLWRRVCAWVGLDCCIQAWGMQGLLLNHDPCLGVESGVYSGQERVSCARRSL